MSELANSWSRAAAVYEQEFIDPYRSDVVSPLLKVLKELSDRRKTAADLGCGIGPLLPFLAEHFATVYAVDFAPGMLERARERCTGLSNVIFLERNLTDLGLLAGQVDVAVAVNSLVMPNLRELETSLKQVRGCLRSGGTFLGIVPAMDAVHYYTMLLLDRALDRGMTQRAACKNAAHLAEHEYYDFAFGQFKYQGLEQHFWQPFEVESRLRRAGFRCVRIERVGLSWEQFAVREDLRHLEPPWDWFFQAELAVDLS